MCIYKTINIKYNGGWNGLKRFAISESHETGSSLSTYAIIACLLFVLTVFSVTAFAINTGNEFFGVEVSHVIDAKYLDKEGKSIISTP